jgi:hypothetical protein
MNNRNRLDAIRCFSPEQGQGLLLPASLSFHVCHEYQRNKLATESVERQKGAGVASRKKVLTDTCVAPVWRR